MSDAGGDEGKILYPAGIAAILAALLFAFAVLPRLFTAPDAALVGKDAPDFSLDAVLNGDGHPVAMRALRGKPVVLDFWATWCGPCQAETPIVDKMAQRYKDRVAVVGVNTSDAPGRARAWAMGRGIKFPIVFDEGDVAKKYGVENLPTLVVVSSSGKILAVRTGITSDGELERLVTSAL